MRTDLETILCKFGRDRAIFVVVEVICAKKFTDRHRHRQTDKRQTPRDCISSWNKTNKELDVYLMKTLTTETDVARLFQL